MRHPQVLKEIKDYRHSGQTASAGKPHSTIIGKHCPNTRIPGRKSLFTAAAIQRNSSQLPTNG